MMAAWLNASHHQREAAMAALVDAGPPHSGLGACDRHSRPVQEPGSQDMSLGPVV